MARHRWRDAARSADIPPRAGPERACIASMFPQRLHAPSAPEPGWVPCARARAGRAVEREPTDRLHAQTAVQAPSFRRIPDRRVAAKKLPVNGRRRVRGPQQATLAHPMDTLEEAPEGPIARSGQKRRPRRPADEVSGCADRARAAGLRWTPNPRKAATSSVSPKGRDARGTATSLSLPRCGPALRGDTCSGC